LIYMRKTIITIRRVQMQTWMWVNVSSQTSMKTSSNLLHRMSQLSESDTREIKLKRAANASRPLPDAVFLSSSE